MQDHVGKHSSSRHTARIEHFVSTAILAPQMATLGSVVTR